MLPRPAPSQVRAMSIRQRLLSLMLLTASYKAWQCLCLAQQLAATQRVCTLDHQDMMFTCHVGCPNANELPQPPLVMLILITGGCLVCCKAHATTPQALTAYLAIILGL